MTQSRDHGGGIDHAITEFGGTRASWIDLSTGINPNPYPLPDISPDAWANLPDHLAISVLESAARQFWNVPDTLEVVAAGGASALIAAMPRALNGKTVHIPEPTYNEHRAAFEACNWALTDKNPDAIVVINPNNPDGRFWETADIPTAPQIIIDESFCDIAPERSLLSEIGSELTTIILKSFGKFWGLAGLRLGFALCPPHIATKLRDQLGPWAVSGPTCEIGTRALSDQTWAEQTRLSLKASAQRLDGLLSTKFKIEGGTDLFRLISSNSAKETQDHLAKHHILTRIFPYSDTWVRFGLPGSEDHSERLQKALKTHP